ncbi:MAG: Trk family potassium uptake protein [Chloroflexi bacterium]|nr:Trk family potassium uptake protein [Chloroflexota bacterium]
MPNPSDTTLHRRRRPADTIVRVTRVKPWRVLIPAIPRKTATRASLWTLPYGFASMIAIGTILLMLPFSSNSGQPTSFIDALFTATSSVCVTGLVVVDTWDYWSFFGQSVILVLIQLGGFGYMTMATLFLVALGRRIGLRERLLIGESIGLSRIGGVVRLIRNMVFFTLVAEVIGAVIFYLRFSSEFLDGTAVWRSVFQSVSAFNNAGFDVFGGFRSLTTFHGDYLVLLTTAILVVIGGISFLVVEDVFQARKPRKFSFDTKMVLSVTFLLLALGTAVVLVTEYANPETLGTLALSDKIVNAFFQSVTSRTSGFSAIPTGSMAAYALFFTMFLMFIGGASGSTAGGIKVNTFGLIMVTIWNVIRGKEHPGAFGREFVIAQIFRALAVLILSMGVVAVMVFILTITESHRFLELLFEAVSAFATVGLSTGMTPDLSPIGRLVIIITMFIGRLGPLTITLALVRAQQTSIYRYPKEVVRIG